MIFLLSGLFSIDKLDIFFDYMNKVDHTKKNQFTLKVATDRLELSGRKFMLDK